MYNDKEIINGFRRGDRYFFQLYFYNYCQTAYNIFDKKYELSKKENLDFMSLAHQYAIYLMEHDWKPLEDRSPNVSLRTWMINGFRYIVLDALKWYKKEYGTLTFQDYLASFDTNQDLKMVFHNTIVDLCDTTHLGRTSRTILVLLLVNGMKTKEVAERIGISPAAVSQRYNTLKKEYIIPYFREHFDTDFDMPEIMDTKNLTVHLDMAEEATTSYSSPGLNKACNDISDDEVPKMQASKINFSLKKIFMKKKRTTPAFIDTLEPGEIFVFGSNLRGLHGGGAAYVAYRKFGAIMGQGVGLQGQSYAIPTMQGGVETIKPYVDEFIEFARQHQELTFLVTRIGCGIAGFNDWDIAPLFEKAHGMENVVLPEGW